MPVSKDEPERIKKREALRKMSREEIRKKSEDEFFDTMQWILQDTSLVMGTEEHKAVMMAVARSYPDWYDVFKERWVTE